MKSSLHLLLAELACHGFLHSASAKKNSQHAVDENVKPLCFIKHIAMLHIALRVSHVERFKLLLYDPSKGKSKEQES